MARWFHVRGSESLAIRNARLAIHRAAVADSPFEAGKLETGNWTLETDMSMIKEFREFASRGNVVDLAVGVILGAAFGKIVTSFVNDIVMPPIGMVMGRIDFKSLYVSLNGQRYRLVGGRAKGGRADHQLRHVSQYGARVYLSSPFVIFLMVRQLNRLKTPAPAPPTEDARDCPFCVSRISSKATRCPQCTSELGAARA